MVQPRGPRARARGQGGGGAGAEARGAGAGRQEQAGELEGPGGPQGAPLLIVARGAGEARGEEGPSPARTYPGVTSR